MTKKIKVQIEADKLEFEDPTTLIDELMEKFKKEVNLQYLCAKHAFNHLAERNAYIIFPDTGEWHKC